MKETDEVNDLVRTIDLMRHDWLNDLQILYGYAQLNKVDKLLGSLEKIKQRLYQESYISRLGNSTLIAFLYAYRLQPNHMQLNLEFNKEVTLSDFPSQGVPIADFWKKMIEIFHERQQTTDGDPNQLHIYVDRTALCLRLSFTFIGLIQSDKLNQDVEQLLNTYITFISLESQRFTDDQKEIIVNVRVPFKTSQ